MHNNPRSLIETTMNTASMGAFMLPGPGPAIGMALMAAPIIMNVFFPIEDNIDPENALPTNGDLTRALNELRNGVAKDAFDAELRQAQSQLITLYSSIEKVWAASVDAGEGLRARVADGPMFITDVITEVQEKTWQQRFERFQEPIFDVNSPILNIKNWIELHPQYKTETLPLYCLAGSLWAMYCKFNIAWEYNLILLNYRRKLEAHEEHVNAMDLEKALVKWQFTGKAKGEPKPEYPPKPPVPLEMVDVREHSEFCSQVLKYLPDFIDYAKPIAAELKQNFVSRRMTIARRLGQLEIRERGSGRTKTYYYYDSNTRQSSKPVRNKRLAMARMRAKQGSLRLGLDRQLTRRYGLDKISEKDIDDLLKTIELWEATVTDIESGPIEVGTSSVSRRNSVSRRRRGP
ncbi:MAG: hypothetical protein AAGI92_04280 [Pseudomonadota bacterium]